MFLNSDVSQVTKIYVGKRNCCRCGCKGEYFTDGNDKRMKRAKKLINDMLKQIVAIGNDVYKNGSKHTGSILIEEMSIASS